VEPITLLRVPLPRIKDQRWLRGICAGFGHGPGIPAWVVRPLRASLVLVEGFGILWYVLFWISMPAWDHVPEDDEIQAGG
jgi:phage shock protein PspC (stress-responsive transcriptional regulator)